MRHLNLFIVIILTLSTVAVYGQLWNHDFIYYDDDKYVLDNHHIKKGINLESLTWTFTTSYAANWHPLTWLSHMLDYRFYGLNPKGHHLTNLFLHITNTLLLFLILYWMTKAPFRSSFVALLFAIHPLHVETVAWIAERKDVLSTFFFMLTILAYINYVEYLSFKRYFWVWLCFFLGLMSKPMLVTLPFVLLLLDYWPLGRLEGDQSLRYRNLLSHYSIRAVYQKFPLLALVIEKVPLILLSIASSIITYIVQQKGGAIQSWDEYPLVTRIANSILAYVNYMGKMILPKGLAIFYPHPGYSLSMSKAVPAGLLLICVFAAIIKGAKRYPYLIVGWLWYLGVLFPVIGLIQIGLHAMADRYTYVSLIGLFVIVSWGSADMAEKFHFRRIYLSLLAGALISYLMILTWFQVHHWRNSMALFEHAVNVTQNNYVMHNNLGAALFRYKRPIEAKNHFSIALRIKPNYVEAITNLGNFFSSHGELDKAIEQYEKAIALNPSYEGAYYNLATVLEESGRIDEAIEGFINTLNIRPDHAKAHNNLGITYAKQGKYEKAIKHFSEALRITPDDAFAKSNIELAMQKMKNSN